MKPKTGAMIGIFASSGVSGLAAAWALGGDVLATICHAITIFLAGLFPFAWIQHDRRERGLPRSRAFNMALIWLAVVAVPVYLWRSRPRGQRLRSLLGMAGVAIGAQFVALLALFVGFVIVAMTMRFPGV